MVTKKTTARKGAVRKPSFQTRNTKKPMPIRGRRRDTIRSIQNGNTDNGSKNTEDHIRIIPIGGVEEVGRNLIIIEIGNDIFISDMGFEFVSELDNPGIDYILPNTKYLEARKKRIRAVFITHGHLDHIGGIPYIMPRIGNPPIYTRALTSLLIKKRQAEFPHLEDLDIKVIEPGERFKVGGTYVHTFPVTHSIPDSMGFMLETKHGNIVISGDLKLDHKNEDPTKAEKDVWKKVGKENNLFFIADSTNAHKAGWSIPEKEVHKNLDEIIGKIKGRIIVGTFASQFERMIKIIEIANKYGRKIIFDGRSIRTNIEIAQQSGMLTIDKKNILPIQEIGDHPADKVLVLATGAQGEEYAVLPRAARGQHKYLKFNERDTIILSSSVIPGNEAVVEKLKSVLVRNGLKLIHYRTSDVHSTGHGNAGELVWITNQVKPKFFMPGYGHQYMTYAHADFTVESGFPRENIIIPDNGTIIDIIDGKKIHIHKEKAPAQMMMVDGNTVGEIQEAVIKDRKILSEDGIFVVIATLDAKTGRLLKSPDIISRGFVYLKESQELLREARKVIRRTIEDTTNGSGPANFDYVKTSLKEKTSRFLSQRTGKKPIVLPVILEI